METIFLVEGMYICDIVMNKVIMSWSLLYRDKNSVQNTCNKTITFLFFRLFTLPMCALIQAVEQTLKPSVVINNTWKDILGFTNINVHTAARDSVQQKMSRSIYSFSILVYMASIVWNVKNHLSQFMSWNNMYSPIAADEGWQWILIRTLCSYMQMSSV